MNKKHFGIALSTIVVIAILCFVAVLFCKTDYTGSSSSCSLEDYTLLHDDLLDLTYPVKDDWSTMGQGIDKSQCDYKDYEYESYDKCIEDLKNCNSYFSTCGLKDFQFVYDISGFSDMTPDKYNSLSTEERKKLGNDAIADMLKQCDGKVTNTEFCTLNGVDWYHIQYKYLENKIDSDVYIGCINDHVLQFNFDRFIEYKNQYSTEQIFSFITDPNAQVTTSGSKSFTDRIQDVIKLNDIPLLSFGAFLLIVMLFGLKVARPRVFFEDAISLKVSKGVQGLAALGIVLHHLVQKLPNEDLTGIKFFENMGVVFVGIFFFFSGYGLLLSVNTKDNYLRGFLKKRMPILLLPFFLSSWMYIIVRMMTGETIGHMRLLELITTYRLPNVNAWYVTELFFLYLVFYLSYRFIKNRNLAYAVNGIFCVALVVGSLLLGHCTSSEEWFKGEWWYNSTMLFFVGMTYAQFRNKLLPIIKKLYWILLPVFTVAFAVLYHFTVNRLNDVGYWTETETSKAYMDKFATLSLQLPMVICFIIAFLLLTMKVKFGNRFTRFVGTFTLELYLVQNMYIGFMNKSGALTNSALYMLQAFVFSVFTGWALHRLCVTVIGLFKKKEDLSQQTTSPVQRNKLFDICRLIMCFLVVCIHIPFPGNAGDIIISYGKIAVPFFIVISGYFCYRNDTGAFATRLKKQGGHILSLTVWANLLYALVFYIRNGSDVFTGLLTNNSIYDFIFFNQSPFSAHLWFLGSLAFAIGIMIVINKLKVADKVIYAFPILLAIYFLNWRMDGNMDKMIQYRNAIACTLGYFMAGCVIRKHEDWIKDHIRPLAVVLAASLLFAGVALEYTMCNNTAIPYYSAELLTIVIVLVCIVFAGNNGSATVSHQNKYLHSLSLQELGRNCSLYVYIFQIACIYVLQHFLGEDSSLLTKVGPVTVFIVTLVLSYIISAIKKIIYGRAGNN